MNQKEKEEKKKLEDELAVKRRPSLAEGSGSFYLNLSQTFDSSFGTQINFTVGDKTVSITTANINTIVKKYAEFVFISFGLSSEEGLQLT